MNRFNAAVTLPLHTQLDSSNESVTDLEEIAIANQQRMYIDHNEVIFMQVRIPSFF